MPYSTFNNLQGKKWIDWLKKRYYGIMQKICFDS